MDIDSGDIGIRPREVDVFHGANRVLGLRGKVIYSEPFVIDDDDFPSCTSRTNSAPDNF